MEEAVFKATPSVAWNTCSVPPELCTLCLGCNICASGSRPRSSRPAHSQNTQYSFHCADGSLRCDCAVEHIHSTATFTPNMTENECPGYTLESGNRISMLAAQEAEPLRTLLFSCLQRVDRSGGCDDRETTHKQRKGSPQRFTWQEWGGGFSKQLVNKRMK